MTRITVLDTGVANLASIRSAFRVLGCETVTVTSTAEAADATHIVIPGVGSFGRGMAAFNSNGLDEFVRDGFQQGIPILAICLGMQLLTDGSEEDPGVPGLGLIEGTCVRLPSDVNVPHLGWNTVSPDGGCTLLTEGDAAFANSYCLQSNAGSAAAAWTRHGVDFVAGLEVGSFLVCQFHPELSGDWGMDLVRNWVAGESRSSKHRVPARRVGLTSRIIPCLDVRDGRVVKGISFQDIRDVGDPAELAARYQSQGADEIVVLDITASLESRSTKIDTVRRVRAELQIPLTVGGGIRTPEDARELLASGADKISVNTQAVLRPKLIEELADEFGRQCVVLAIDARRRGEEWEVVTHGGRNGTDKNAVDWAKDGVARGAGEILLTSFDRDGTRAGCDLELLAAVNAAVNVPIIASGGVGDERDVQDALTAGADAVLAASIFHYGEKTVRDVKLYLRDNGTEVRL